MTAGGSGRGTGRIVYLVPLVTCALGLVAAGSIWANELSQERQRDLQAANQIATTLSQMASASIDGLRGGSAMLADDGMISPAELATFADDMAREADLRTVSHQPVVQDADRAAFEAEHGFGISDIGPDGTLVPAAQRPVYAPVVAVEYDDPSIVPSYGLDILGDARRAEGARVAAERDLPSLSPPIEFTRTNRTGYMSVVALRGPEGDVVGYLTGSFAVDDVLEAARDAVDPEIDVAVFDDGVRVAGSLEGGASTDLQVGGRTLTVFADEGTPPNVWPALAVAAGAVLASVALALALLSLRRSERAASQLAANLETERAQALRLAAPRTRPHGGV